MHFFSTSIQGFGLGIQGLGFRSINLGLCFRLIAKLEGTWVQGLGFTVQGWRGVEKNVKMVKKKTTIVFIKVAAGASHITVTAIFQTKIQPVAQVGMGSDLWLNSGKGITFYIVNWGRGGHIKLNKEKNRNNKINKEIFFLLNINMPLFFFKNI